MDIVNRCASLWRKIAQKILTIEDSLDTPQSVPHVEGVARVAVSVEYGRLILLCSRCQVFAGLKREQGDQHAGCGGVFIWRVMILREGTLIRKK